MINNQFIEVEVNSARMLISSIQHCEFTCIKIAIFDSRRCICVPACLPNNIVFRHTVFSKCKI